MNTSNVLIVLGNGYDIAWGYPTQYNNFYKHSKELQYYADNGNQLCHYILTHYDQDSLWSDLENGLYIYSRELTKKNGAGNVAVAEQFEKEFKELRMALFNYLVTISEDSKAVIEQAPVMGLSVEWREVSPQYLTFNYSTTTFGGAAGNNKSFLGAADEIKSDKFVHQHGAIYNTSACCNNSPDQLVLGIDENSQKVEELHSFLYKSRQNVHDLHETMQTIDQKQLYIIYGCSIGDSDKMYFERIFCQKEKEYIIYYYDDKALTMLKNNIAKITGSFAIFEKENQVSFLNLKDVVNTRTTTRDILRRYAF